MNIKNNIPKIFSFDYIVTFVGLAGQLMPYIQAFKIFYIESAHAVSLSAYIIAFLSMVCWLAYGVSRKIKPLIITNLFGLIGVFFVLIGVLYYE